jgi:hypothetical protein
VPTEADGDPSACFPSRIRKLGGFDAVLESIEEVRREANLPTLNPNDYKVAVGAPSGLPYAFPVQVIYLSGTSDEVDLGTFRVSR